MNRNKSTVVDIPPSHGRHSALTRQFSLLTHSSLVGIPPVGIGARTQCKARSAVIIIIIMEKTEAGFERPLYPRNVESLVTKCYSKQGM